MKNKQLMGLLVSLLLMAAALPAFAQEAAIPEPAVPTANATVVAPEVDYVTAPFGGTLLPFSWAKGDMTAEKDVLFELRTTKVYATQAGVIGAMFAAPGQDAAGVISRYGALCAIEPGQLYYIAASTATAHNHRDNKLVHTGELLHLKKDSTKGTGRVTSVAQDQYVVEVLTGDFKLADSITCYREPGYAKDSSVGAGPLMRYNDTLVSATGRVFAVHKKEGDRVREGDLLLEMIEAASEPNTASCAITAPATGAVTALHTLPGAYVYQGQLLCEIADLSKLELSVQVDELYLSTISDGDTLTFLLDAFGDKVFKGTVKRILPMGTNRQNAAYYDVRLTIPGDANILPGMNATVYLSGGR